MDNRKLRFFYGNKDEHLNFFTDENEDKDKKYYFYLITSPAFDEQNNPVINEKGEQLTILELYYGQSLLATTSWDNTVKNKVEELMDNYVKNNSTITVDEENKNVSISGGLNVEENISAANLSYNQSDDSFQTNKMFLTNLNVEETITSNMLNSEEILSTSIKIGDMELNSESVNIPQNTNIKLPKILKHIDTNNDIIWSLDTETGELTIQKLTVLQETVYNNITYGNTPTFTQIQIGNIILKEENGDLKIITPDINN